MSLRVQVVDGRVTNPPLSDVDRPALLATMRAAVPGTAGGDFQVVVRLMYDVLVARPSARKWPVVCPGRGQWSLFREIVLAASAADAPALESIEDDSVLAAVNVARWLLGLPQQPSLTPVVFVEPEARPVLAG